LLVRSVDRLLADHARTGDHADLGDADVAREPSTIRIRL
jgi:hypothetical protein